MYRFIGIMKIRKDEIPYRLLLTYKDFPDKKEALKRLEAYNEISIPKARFTIIDKPISVDDFFEGELDLVDKKLCAYESLAKLKKILNMEVIENKKYREIDLLFSDKEAVLDLFDVKEVDHKEIGGVLLGRGCEDNIVLGEPRLEVDSNLEE